MPRDVQTNSSPTGWVRPAYVRELVKEAKPNDLLCGKGLRDHPVVTARRFARDQSWLARTTSEAFCEWVKACNGSCHDASPHHADSRMEVHVLRRAGWYVKFYFLDPDTVFISVHQ
jgi:hypothetical protein